MDIKIRIKGEFLQQRSVMRFFWLVDSNKRDKLCGSFSDDSNPTLSRNIFVHKYMWCATIVDKNTTVHCRTRNGDSKQLLYRAQCVTPSVPFLFTSESCTCFLRSRLRRPPPSSSTVGQIGCRNIDFFRRSTTLWRLLLNGFQKIPFFKFNLKVLDIVCI